MDNQTWDVVVIGGGGAGLSAAVSAAEEGASVLLFESEQVLGGSTQLSAGLFTAAGTSVQAELGVDDSPEKFFQHYMDLNRWLLNPGLIRAFCENAGPALEWLISLGVEIPARESANAHMPGLCQAGVEDLWRGHVPKNEGYGLVQVLERAARSAGVDIVLNTRVEALLSDDNGVSGVIADDEEVRCSAVVIASGGFARDRAMLEKHYPYALRAGDSLFVVSGPGSRGDHLAFGDQVDAAVAGEDWGLMLPTAYFQSRHHWEAGFPPRSRIHVNSAGRRFMNEDASYAVSPGLIDRQHGQTWMVFDETARTSLPDGYIDWNADNVLAEADAGRLLRADSLAGLAEQMSVPAEALEYTVTTWNQELPAGEDPGFLRTGSLATKGMAGPPAPLKNAPYYAARYLPAELVCTHAAPEIDAQARVITRSGRPVPGLFAAGEAGGGVLGSTYVGGGNAVANAITMGRMAGCNAARLQTVADRTSTESHAEETT